MRLADLIQRIKAPDVEFKDLPKDIFVLLLIVLVGLGSFFLGKLSTAERERKSELRVLQSVVGYEVQQKADGVGEDAAPMATPQVPTVSGAYVASRSGKAYYLPWCGGVKLIKEENKIWFATKEEAEAKGYRPAANCKGI